MEQQLSDKVIPCEGFKKGWNVILYDNLIHCCQQVYNDLTELTFSSEVAEKIIHIAGTQGFAVISHSKENNTFENFLASYLRRKGYQVEVFYQE